VAAAAVGLPLVVQLPRDYLFNLGQHSSHFGGSRYMAVLKAIGPPSAVVETDYLYSTALFSGHVTARSTFDATFSLCYTPDIDTSIAEDGAAFLLLGDVNKPGILNSPCLLSAVDASPWAVRLLHTSRDDASVYELVGPGTGHPLLADLDSRAAHIFSRTSVSATEAIQWETPSVISQVSVGEAAFAGAPTTSTTLEILTSDGRWTPVAHSNSAVGDARHAAPYLLASLPPGTVASGLRVVLTGPDPAAQVAISDLRALGVPAGSSG
jgi:hypothetical protein